MQDRRAGIPSQTLAGKCPDRSLQRRYTSPSRLSPICASGSRALAFPTKRRGRHGLMAPTRNTYGSWSNTGKPASTGGRRRPGSTPSRSTERAVVRRDEAVLTGAAGGALGLSGRGVVAVGAYADFCCSLAAASGRADPGLLALGPYRVAVEEDCSMPAGGRSARQGSGVENAVGVSRSTSRSSSSKSRCGSADCWHRPRKTMWRRS
jgi:hypothetical protein